MTSEKFSHSNYSLTEDDSDRETSKKNTKSKKPAARRSQRKKKESTTNDLTNEFASNDYDLGSNKKLSKSENAAQMTELKKLIHDLFGYEVKEVDTLFLKQIFTDLPKLFDIWKRIGFKKEIKLNRLNKFYSTLTDTYHQIIDNEEDLEENILKSIEEQCALIKELCLELHTKWDESKLISNTLTMLEKDDLLRAETKRLHSEKKKRLDEFKTYSTNEAELCAKLGMQRTQIKAVVPSQQDIVQLSKRITELNELHAKRLAEMTKLKEEIMQISDELDVSNSDSFAEMILFEAPENMSLAENDIMRAKEFRDELRIKDNELKQELKSLRVKIKELWTKMNIENSELKAYINAGGVQMDSQKSNKKLVIELREEHARCVELKMQNMQKFIESIRAEIKDYCSKMFMSDQEMKKMGNELLNSNIYTEELLLQHERKLDDLKFSYNEFSSLYEKTSKWIELWSEFVKFEEVTKDPARLKVRGYSMLNEEKQRKAFNTQLPKLEEEIRLLADEYNQTNKFVYNINGLFFSEYIQRKKYDHEESKQNERKEKQIMRDNIKKNESRYGSKPVTPLALRHKRKLAGGHDTQMQTPTNLTRVAKQQKTSDITCNSAINKTPKYGRTGGIGSSHVSTVKQMSLAAKRKSRTPAKNRMRRSRMLALVNQSSAVVTTASTEQSSYETIASSHGDITIKTTTSLSSNNTQSTSNLNSIYNCTSQSRLTVNSSSNSTQNSLRSSKSKAVPSQTVNKNKYPPPSASSKYSAAAYRMENLCTNIMTSTASNTFIEEEGIDAIENAAILHKSKVNNALGQAASKLKSNGYKFQQGSTTPAQLAACEINYMEFSRDLPKPIRFGTNSTNFNSTASSGLI